MKPIGVVTSIPAAGVLPGTGVATNSFRTTSANALEITGKCSAGSGNLILLRWHLDIGTGGEWRPWKQDRPIEANIATTNAFFSGVYYLGSYLSNDWLVWNPSSVTIVDCFADQVDYQKGG